MNNKLETNVIKPDVSLFMKENEFRILSKQDEELLDSKVKELYDFLSEKRDKGLSEDDKDNLYAKAKGIWKEFFDIHSVVKYQFNLNRQQQKFLSDLLINKIEYDVSTVFFGVGLKDFLNSFRAKYSNDDQIIGFDITATEITYIYHLISKYKVKGLGPTADTYSQVLIRIGEISKIFNFYETTNKNMSTDIQNWVVTLEDGVTAEDSVSANTIEPKKGKKEKAA